MSDNWTLPAPIPSINVPTPEFPAVVIGFSRNSENVAYDLLRFENQQDFRHYRALHIGPVRVIRDANDLKHVHDPILRELYLMTETEVPQDLTHEELMGGINIALLKSNATPYEETIMGTAAAEGTTTTTEPTNKTEAKSAEKAAAKAQKEAEKAKAKKEREEKRQDGVIGNIKKHLERTEGATVEETLNALVAKFPDRTRDGMGSTVKIQFSRLAKSTGRKIVNEKIKGRGRVYKFADAGPIPGEVDTGEVKVAAPAATAPASESADTTLAEKQAAKKGSKSK